MAKDNRHKDKKSIVNWLINHKWISLLILGTVYFVPIFIFVNCNIETENIMESVCYLSQIISGLFVVLGTGMAVLQYIFNSNTARNEADKQRKIAAAKMANEFKDIVIPSVSELSVAYKNPKLLKEVINYLDNSNLEHFNKEEIDKLFPNELYMQYRVEIAQNYLLQKDEKFRALHEKFQNDKNLTEEEKDALSEEMSECLFAAMKEISSMCTQLSNTLEYMCICFNTNIADDETVYQSLHSVFFKAVHMIYIYAFVSNENEYNRLFYNIMILYKKWKVLNRQKQLEEKECKEKLEEKMNSLKNAYNEKIAVKTQCE